MPDQARVRSFIDAVVSGDHVGAIRDYYHIDAQMRENAAPPRMGRDVLLAHEESVLARTSMRTHAAPPFLVDGDLVAIQWTFDMTDDRGVTRRLEELAMQRWSGNRISSERFFYNPEEARKPLAGS